MFGELKKRARRVLDLVEFLLCCLGGILCVVFVVRQLMELSAAITLAYVIIGTIAAFRSWSTAGWVTSAGLLYALSWLAVEPYGVLASVVLCGISIIGWHLVVAKAMFPREILPQFALK